MSIEEQFSEALELATKWGIVYVPDGKVYFTDEYRAFIRSTASGDMAEKMVKLTDFLIRKGVPKNVCETWASTQLFVQSKKIVFPSNKLVLVVGLVDSLLEVGK